jgi:RNase E specificity factor CsrD
MRLTNQIVALLCLCVIGTVLLVLTAAGMAFHGLTEQFQRDELRAVVDIFEQEVLAQPDSPRLQGWLPPLLQANGVKGLTVTLDDGLLFQYQEPTLDEQLPRLEEVRLAGQHYPTLHMDFWVEPSFRQLDRLYAPITSLVLGFVVISAGLWLALLWLRRQLKGVELLARRGQHILSADPGKLRHDTTLEWPLSASQALTFLQNELADAKKERSRFDTFIRRNVFIDKQLGIGNRIFFDNRLEAAMSDADYSVGSVLLLEVEALESILRQEGEDRANEGLLECSTLVGQFLQRHAGAIQGRYAGNILAILLPGLSKQETLTAAEQLFRRLQHLSWPDYVDGDRALYIGAVCYQPGELMMQVEEEAELALRGARLQQEAGYFLYDKLLRVDASDKGTVRWRTLLERQFSRHQLTYRLQSAFSGKPLAPHLHEMLARLPDGKGTLLPAAVFVAMVEKVGMLLPFDRQMTQLALLLLPGEEGVPLALNLHPLSLLDAEYRHWLLMALLRLGRRRAAMLVLELNEALVNRYQEALRAPLRELRLLGCRLSVDHAGQDVVSTHYIKEFELSFLKIHPSLVRDIQHRPLNQMAVRSLVGGCANSQTQVIAVGVESEMEWKVLQSLGVVGGQGHWFDNQNKI